LLQFGPRHLQICPYNPFSGLFYTKGVPSLRPTKAHHNNGKNKGTIAAPGYLHLHLHNAVAAFSFPIIGNSLSFPVHCSQLPLAPLLPPSSCSCLAHLAAVPMSMSRLPRSTTASASAPTQIDPAGWSRSGPSSPCLVLAATLCPPPHAVRCFNS
jgi:hypothetical protein